LVSVHILDYNAKAETFTRRMPGGHQVLARAQQGRDLRYPQALANRVGKRYRFDVSTVSKWLQGK
jgi:hypothetical protein